MVNKTYKGSAKTATPGLKRKSTETHPSSHKIGLKSSAPNIKIFDPELLYIECGRCGAPIIWEPGRISQLLEEAGIDPIELDASCLLMTDSCKLCGQGDEYSIRIFRFMDKTNPGNIPPCGHA